MTKLVAPLALAGALLAGTAQAVDGQIPPPPEYDHPYGGKVVIEQYHTVASLREACGVSTAVGCMLREDGKTCVIARVDDRILAWNQWTKARVDALIRHETGHCNGWRHTADETVGGGADESAERRSSQPALPGPGVILCLLPALFGIPCF
jgi:hypothetical protein